MCRSVLLVLSRLKLLSVRNVIMILNVIMMSYLATFRRVFVRRLMLVYVVLIVRLISRLRWRLVSSRRNVRWFVSLVIVRLRAIVRSRVLVRSLSMVLWRFEYVYLND